MSARGGAIERDVRGGGWIEKWNPEDEEFWEAKGKRVARRNLVFSIFAEFLGFSVWQLFSIVAALLPLIGFAFTAPQLLGLVAIPPLVGATMRFPYTFAVGSSGVATGPLLARFCS